MKPIVVTGASGLIGAALVARLRDAKVPVTGIDCRPSPFTDIVKQLGPNDRAIGDLVADARGIVHLAGVSRVVWAERDPARCWTDNVGLTAGLLDAIARSETRPWFVYASSREVYGQAAQLPVTDATPIAPINVYGCSKAASEALVAQSGLLAAVLRFSTVYGGLEDHADRVIPAFVRAALAGESLTVCGNDVSVDPTWIGDVIDAITALVAALEQGRQPSQPLLLTSGSEVRLRDLATQICAMLASDSGIEVQPARSYDVARFAGHSAYTVDFLGWQATTSLDAGLHRFAEALRHVR